MKPEKVKSRWRRNSEMENTEKSNMSPTTLEPCEENSCNVKNESLVEELAINAPNHESFPSYESLDENFYLFEIKRTKRKKEVRRMICDCPLAKDDEIPCGDECLNRLLMIECDSRCVNGDTCSNKRFQKRLNAKAEPFMTAKKGWGLKLLENVSKGSFIIEYVGEVINLKNFRQRVKQYARKTTNHFYFMALKSDQIIDASMKANASRFINHSCDPNIETQKWTVNGLLRVGFFATRDIEAGEELTFDYQFERYGKEAQKCYCETEKCNGFIGVSSDITVDIYNNDSKCNSKRKKLEERKKEVLEDKMLEKDIEKLSITGIRNKEETLMLARLMVRAENSLSKEKLLDIILLNTTEVACLRLFLDYHGLSLIWSWMAYLNDCNLKTKILKALYLLPVPNRTILRDSKVLNVVEKWASIPLSNSDNYSDSSKKKCDTSDSETDGVSTVDSDKKASKESPVSQNTSKFDLRSDDESIDMGRFFYPAESNGEIKLSTEISSLAQNLLEKWKLLKDDFRIPRREKQDLIKNESDSESTQNSLSKNSNDVTKIIHKTENRTQTHNIKEQKDSKESYFNEEPQEIKVVCNMDDKYSSYRKWGEYPHQSKYLKEDKRSSFTDQSDRRNWWKEKKSKDQCKNISLTNHFNDFSDVYFSPCNQSYDSYALPPTPSNNESSEYPGGNHYNSFSYKINTNAPRPPLLPTPGTQSNIMIGRPPEGSKETICDPPSTQNVFVPHLVQMPFLPIIPSVQSPTANFPSNLPLPPPPLQQHLISVQSDSVQSINSSTHFAGSIPPVADSLLSAASFMHATSDQNPLQIGAGPHINESFQAQENTELPSKVLPSELPPNWKAACDDDGNIYYYHAIDRKPQWEFPSVEESVPADLDNGTPTYDEPDLKHATKSRRSNKKHSKRKSLTTAPADTSSSNQVNNEIAKKIKELFRTKMSSFVVQCLNPYRKDNCRVGRITSNEDFKHLARKLTHFVMAKELKHCKNVEDLDCNENVKHKARDYIHKYMARYGPLYHKDKCLSFGDEKYSE